ncbi:MAG: chromosome segregation ATPase [Akkermansiaceae bacterium]|jgi:chromosome segregation ATPase
MTRTRFSIAALLQSFGVIRKTKRLTDSAFEMHLMQDGEELLGSFCWRNLEEIEDLSMEYWNLRRMDREEQALMQKLRESEDSLTAAQANRADFVDRSRDIGQNLFQKREDLFQKVENLNIERDELMGEATATKRKHAALKMKAEVLREEGDANKEKLEKCGEVLKDLKEEFTARKSVLTKINARISAQQEKLAGLQVKIDEKLESSKGDATESFAQISEANRDITNYRSELGLLNEEQGAVFREVGRFLNLNATREDCRKSCEDHRGLLEQTRLLYRSIQWNRRLIERVTK